MNIITRLALFLVMASALVSTCTAESATDLTSRLIQDANSGMQEAQHQLGVMYYSGQGVEKNLKKAVAYLRQAQTKGYTPARKDLAILYYNEAVRAEKREDNSTAEKYYAQALELGDTQSDDSLKAFRKKMKSDRMRALTKPPVALPERKKGRDILTACAAFVFRQAQRTPGVLDDKEISGRVIMMPTGELEISRHGSVFSIHRLNPNTVEILSRFFSAYPNVGIPPEKSRDKATFTFLLQ